MDKHQAIQRLHILRKNIEELRYRYHVVNDPTVDEAVLDSLKRELLAIEEEFPDLVTLDSPSQRVSGNVREGFSKIKHTIPMGSLHDVFTLDELRAWDQRNRKLVGDTTYTYFAEVKMDGVAIGLTYQDGLLIQAVTRGDGDAGEDITENAKTIQSIPLRLSYKGDNKHPRLAGIIEVRGEVYMPLSVFNALNEQQQQNGKPLFANPRNVVSGTIRQLDSAVVTERNLDCFIYSVVQGVQDEQTHSAVHTFARELGFKVTPHERVCTTLEDVEQFWKDLQKQRPSLPYWIDGVVVSVDEIAVQESMGAIGKGPRWSVAFKFPAERASAVIEDIVVQVGRTGVLTPVAHLTPTVIAGTTVKRASLHNDEEIKAKDIRIGDTVVIHKAGDIIPEVVEVILSFRTGKETPFFMPTTCPVCHAPVDKEEKLVAYKCSNKQCFAQQRERFLHAVSKDGFAIDGLGEGIIDALCEAELIEDIADIFTITIDDFLQLPLFGEKKAQNCFDAIVQSKTIALPKYIHALGIPLVGAETAELLVPLFATIGQSRDFDLRRQKTEVRSQEQEDVKKTKQQELFAVEGKVEKEGSLLSDGKQVEVEGYTPHSIHQILQHLTKEQLLTINGIGDKVADAIIAFAQEPSTLVLGQKLTEAGVGITIPESHEAFGPLAGKHYVFTGTLEKFTRDEAAGLIKKFGAKEDNSILKTTTTVVAGANAGSKLAKAQRKGIAILDEQAFIALLESCGWTQ